MIKRAFRSRNAQNSSLLLRHATIVGNLPLQRAGRHALRQWIDIAVQREGAVGIGLGREALEDVVFVDEVAVVKGNLELPWQVTLLQGWLITLQPTTWDSEAYLCRDHRHRAHQPPRNAAAASACALQVEALRQCTLRIPHGMRGVPNPVRSDDFCALCSTSAAPSRTPGCLDSCSYTRIRHQEPPLHTMAM